MKKFLVIIFLFLASCCGFAQEASKPMIQLPNGKLVKAADPFPVGIQPVNVVASQVATLTANVSKEITTLLPTEATREFLHINSMTEGAAFRINFNGAAATSTAMLVRGWVSLPVSKDIRVYVISESNLDLYIFEGGRQ